MKFIRTYLAKKSKRFLVELSCVLVVVLGLLDFITGAELAFSIFYLLPVTLSVWFTDRTVGVLISCASAVSWLIADMLSTAGYSHPAVPYWNSAVLLGLFLTVAYTLAALRNSLEHEKELARTDSLTGVSNRRRFFELIHAELHRAKRYKRPMTVAYMDMDDFKVINDRFGHTVGDKVLSSAAHAIQKNIRTVDVVARFGGDEFAILLPETDSDGAKVIIRRIQENLQNSMQKQEWGVTFSIGVFTCNGKGLTVDDVLTKADSLMYAAKNNGKNTALYETAAPDVKAVS